MKENTKYFTVPIGMLKGLISGERDMMECASDIIDYSLYYHAVRLPFTSECNEITTQLKASAEFFPGLRPLFQHILRPRRRLLRFWQIAGGGHICAQREYLHLPVVAIVYLPLVGPGTDHHRRVGDSRPPRVVLRRSDPVDNVRNARRVLEGGNLAGGTGFVVEMVHAETDSAVYHVAARRQLLRLGIVIVLLDTTRHRRAVKDPAVVRRVPLRLVEPLEDVRISAVGEVPHRRRARRRSHPVRNDVVVVAVMVECHAHAMLLEVADAARNGGLNF